MMALDDALPVLLGIARGEAWERRQENGLWIAGKDKERALLFTVDGYEIRLTPQPPSDNEDPDQILYSAPTFCGYPRVRDLPRNEQAPFSAWLENRDRPDIEGETDWDRNDGFYPGDYLIWRAQQ